MLDPKPATPGMPTHVFSRDGVRGLVERLTLEIGFPKRLREKRRALEDAAQALTALLEEREGLERAVESAEANQAIWCEIAEERGAKLAEVEALEVAVDDALGAAEEAARFLLRGGWPTEAGGVRSQIAKIRQALSAASARLDAPSPNPPGVEAMREALVKVESVLGFHEGTAEPEFDGARPTIRLKGEDHAELLAAVRQALTSNGSPPISPSNASTGNLAQDDPSSLSAAQAEIVRLREALSAQVKFVDDYFAPWGSWKTAWWEGEVGDAYEFTAGNALRALQRKSRTLLATQAQAEPTLPHHAATEPREED